MPAERVKLADPHGMISRIKSRLNKACAVARSPFCEVVISMRMQGIPFREIEGWLIRQGQEYRIPACTILRNLKDTKLQVNLPYAEELAERWGGSIDLDLVRELQGQILAQRERISRMQKHEAEQAKKRPGWADKRIRGEVETLNGLIKTLQSMMKDPEEAVKERALADAQTTYPVAMSEDGLAVLTELLLSGDLKMGGGSNVKH